MLIKSAIIAEGMLKALNPKPKLKGRAFRDSSSKLSRSSIDKARPKRDKKPLFPDLKPKLRDDKSLGQE